MEPDEEARRILSLHNGNTASALSMVENQLNVLYTRAQVLLSLSGVVISVTGFSGRLIAATDRLAQGLLISGLALVLLSAVRVFSRVMRIRWVTRDLTDDPLATLISAISRRNQKTASYRQGGFLLCVGLALYFGSIAIMLLNPGPVNLPVR